MTDTSTGPVQTVQQPCSGERVNVAAYVAEHLNGRSLRVFCRESGLRESDMGTLSRLLRGLPVTAHTERRIGRALKIIEPPRKLIRRVLTEQQAVAWDSMTNEQRDHTLGIKEQTMYSNMENVQQASIKFTGETPMTLNLERRQRTGGQWEYAWMNSDATIQFEDAKRTAGDAVRVMVARYYGRGFDFKIISAGPVDYINNECARAFKDATQAAAELRAEMGA